MNDYILFMVLIMITEIVSIPYNVDYTQTFELIPNEGEYNEEDENELIRPKDYENSLVKLGDENKYKPLHLYVKNYNQKRSMKNELSNESAIAHLISKWRESETRKKKEMPLIARFKKYLNAVESEPYYALDNGTYNKAMKNDSNYDVENLDYSEVNNTQYEKWKMEYYEQLEHNIDIASVQYSNNTKISNNHSQETVQEIVETITKNCTEGSEKFNMNNIECFVNELKNEKFQKSSTVKRIRKIWLIFKVWCLIYIFFAIILWCQKGWCCCCCRCAACFPGKRLFYVKQYYVANYPGILIKKPKRKKAPEEIIHYEPSEYEQETYKELEMVIRNF